MKYLRIFEKESDYTQYVGGGGDDYVTPHVALVRRTNAVKYKEYDKTNDYCTIEALEDGLTVSFSMNTIQYSTDNCQTWNELPADTATPVINSGDKISFKANGLMPEPEVGIGTFTVNKNFNLKGNVMSMLFGDEGKNSFDLTGYDYAFISLFIECTKLQTISKDFLPATTLAGNCYAYMFYDCSSLVTAPELPTTTLTNRCYFRMFLGCSSLVTAPTLPATELTENCYESMFCDCSSLVTAPTLPATTLAESCYSGMFVRCSSLVTAPALPATELTENCYSGMFAGCSSLVTAPTLPATILANYCYSGMFEGCTSLITAPELPATTLAENCYGGRLILGSWNGMFQGCTSLVTAPELPATTLANECYLRMFQDCTSLVTAPELPATELTENCYKSMFYGCTSLNYIKALFTTTPGSSYTNNWVKGVSSAGTFVKNAEATWNVTGSDGIPEGWTVETVEDYLTIEALENGLTVSFSRNTIQYSTDNCKTWNELPANTATPTINAGDKIYFKATGLTTNSLNGVGIFTVNKNFNLKGNVMSMLFGDEGKNSFDLTGYVGAFNKLFNNCTTLQSVSKDFLPATTLAECCYTGMFIGCTSLVTAPELPATTLTKGCYSSMFYNCTSLTTPPELPATTLVTSCYQNMFDSCTSLVTAPELPATTLVTACYQNMFNNCSSLNYIKALFTTTPSMSTTWTWVSGVSPTGTFVKNAAATWNVTGVNGIPEGWTIETATA